MTTNSQKLDFLIANSQKLNANSKKIDGIINSIKLLGDKVDKNNASHTESFQKLEKKVDKNNASYIESFQKIDKKFEKIDKKFEKIDEKFEKLDEKIEKLDEKIEKINNNYNGYIKKEGEIYEIRANDIFESYLINNNKLYKQLYFGKFYGPTKEITDFDGCFIVNYQELNTIASHQKRLNNATSRNRTPIIYSVSIQKNIRTAHIKPEIIIIEAKHDVDKSKIDNKLLQINEICNILSNNNIQNPIQDYQDMIASDNYKLLKSQFYNNIHLYMAADNWTQNLLKYVNDIFLGKMTVSNYIEHCNIIINTHDKKLINKVIKLGKLADRFIRRAPVIEQITPLTEQVSVIITPAYYTSITNYIKDFESTYDYINSFKFICNKKKNLNDVENYCNIMNYLKTFVIPFDPSNFYYFKNKINVISNFKVLNHL
jgi:hypothetical protein